MEIPGNFLPAALAFLLNCTAMYKDNLVPTDVMFRTIEVENGTARMHTIENLELKEVKVFNDGVSDSDYKMSIIEAQIEEKDGELVIGGQAISEAMENTKHKEYCRGFVLKNSDKLTGITDWKRCSEYSFRMMNNRMYQICYNISDGVLDTRVRDLEGKLLNDVAVKQTALKWEDWILVDSKNERFVFKKREFEKEVCQQVGPDITTWTEDATPCIKEKIALKPNLRSPLYSLGHLFALFREDCPKEAQELGRDSFAEKTYVTLTAKVPEDDLDYDYKPSSNYWIIIYITMGLAVILLTLIIATAVFLCRPKNIPDFLQSDCIRKFMKAIEMGNLMDFYQYDEAAEVAEELKDEEENEEEGEEKEEEYKKEDKKAKTEENKDEKDKKDGNKEKKEEEKKKEAEKKKEKKEGEEKKKQEEEWKKDGKEEDKKTK